MVAFIPALTFQYAHEAFRLPEAGTARVNPGEAKRGRLDILGDESSVIN